MTNLWAEASRDLESEQKDRLSVTASVAAAQFWPFLAASATEREFEHRLGYIEDGLHKAMSDVPEAVRIETTAKLREDYRLLASSRKEASDEVVIDSTTANVGDDVWVFLKGPSGSSSRDGVVTSVDKAGKTVTVKTKSWDGNKTVTISDYSWEDGGSFMTRQGSRKEAEVQGHFTTVQRDGSSGGTWVVKCTCGWSEGVPYRAEGFRVGQQHEDENGGYTVASRKTASGWEKDGEDWVRDGAEVGKEDDEGTSWYAEIFNPADSDQMPSLKGGFATAEEAKAAADSALRQASRKTAAPSDIGVGDQVIWTDFGVPDVLGKELVTYRGRNGEPWTITKIESLWDFDTGPNDGNYGFLPNGETHILDLVQDWADRTQRTHIDTAADTHKIEMAHIERGGDRKVVPLEGLVRSSVEVGPGQGQFSFASQKTASSRVKTLREIVDRHQHQEIDGMIVDVQTANLLLQVYDALSEKNKGRFDSLPLDRLVDLGWAHTSSRKEASGGTYFLCEDCANEAWSRWKTFPISPAISAPAPGVECEKCKRTTPSVFEFKSVTSSRKASRPGNTQRGARELRGATVTWLSGMTGTILDMAPLEAPGVTIPNPRGYGNDQPLRARHPDIPAKEIEACWVSANGKVYWASVHVPNMVVLDSHETDQAVFASRKTATTACSRCSGVAVASKGQIDCMDCGHTARGGKG